MDANLHIFPCWSRQKEALGARLVAAPCCVPMQPPPPFGLRCALRGHGAAWLPWYKVSRSDIVTGKENTLFLCNLLFVSSE